MSLTEDFIRKRLGAFPSPPDPRHYRVRSPTYAETVELPEEYDGLAPYIGAIDDQGNIGSCVGHCGAKAMEITNHLLDMEEDDLSPGWLYRWSRYYANIPDYIEGSTNLGLMKALNKIPGKDESLVKAFGSHLVKPGMVSEKYLEIFNDLERMKKLVKNGKIMDLPKQQILMNREYVRKFIREAGRILKKKSPAKDRKTAKPSKKPPVRKSPAMVKKKQ